MFVYVNKFKILHQENHHPTKTKTTPSIQTAKEGLAYQTKEQTGNSFFVKGKQLQKPPNKTISH